VCGCVCFFSNFFLDYSCRQHSRRQATVTYARFCYPTRGKTLSSAFSTRCSFASSSGRSERIPQKVVKPQFLPVNIPAVFIFRRVIFKTALASISMFFKFFPPELQRDWKTGASSAREFFGRVLQICRDLEIWPFSRNDRTGIADERNFSAGSRRIASILPRSPN